MSDYANHLEKELLTARKEIEELRKRVCVPEGHVVVPVEPSDGHLDSMAMRMRHDFGLLPEYLKSRFRSDARQLYEECTGQGFYKLAAPAPVERVEREDEDRESVVADIFEVLTGHRDQVKWSDSIYTTHADNLYDAGYRKHAPTPQPAPTAAQDVAGLEGQSISIDVSTGDHDAAHRLYGTVTEVAPDGTLLCELDSDNHDYDVSPQWLIQAVQALDAMPRETGHVAPSRKMEAAISHVIHEARLFVMRLDCRLPRKSICEYAGCCAKAVGQTHLCEDHHSGGAK